LLKKRQINPDTPDIIASGHSLDKLLSKPEKYGRAQKSDASGQSSAWQEQGVLFEAQCEGPEGCIQAICTKRQAPLLIRHMTLLRDSALIAGMLHRPAEVKEIPYIILKFC
jgi:hypothetical protein